LRFARGRCGAHAEQPLSNQRHLAQPGFL
jgi:hypothetical protein